MAASDPPRFSAFAVVGKETIACGRDESATVLLERIANELATTDQFGTHEIVIVDRDMSPADLYRIVVTHTAPGTVIMNDEHLRAVLWCPACESMGHTVHACGVVESDGPEPETTAESLGLRGFGGR